MLLDAHLHLRDSRLLPFRDAFLQTMVDTGLQACIDCVSILGQEEGPPPTHPALKITTAYGLHPWDVSAATPHTLSRLETLLQENPNALVGEIGLDGIHPTTPEICNTQKTFFCAQLHLAHTYQRAVILHGAKAWQPLFDLLLNERTDLPAILLHGVNFAPELLQHPFFKRTSRIWFSLGRLVCNPNAKTLHRLLPHLPLNRMLLESDAPDGGLKEGFNFHGFNHPQNLQLTLHHLAQVRKQTPEALRSQLRENATTFLKEIQGL